MDEVYSKINEGEWQIPPSCSYVSDSDSPLSLLPSPPSVPSSPIISAANVMMSMMIPSSAYNQAPFNHIKTGQEDNEEEAKYHSVMFHEHIIADNDSIACVRPQSVSIKWSNHATLLPNKEEPIEDESDSSSNDESVRPTTSIHDSIKLVITHHHHNDREKRISLKEPIALIGPEENTDYKKRKEYPSMNATQAKKKKRTVTSYDSQTSLYLKSVFFEVYSQQSKLTKEQRVKVQERTGLPSRNITYWFSNHKRRFQNTLKIYRKAVRESEGAVKSYDEFIQWRRRHSLPDQVTQEEILAYQED